MTTISDRVCGLVAHDLGLLNVEVTPAARLVEDLGADLLDRTSIVMSLEEVFSIDITDEQMEQLATVNDAIALVDELRAARKAA